MFGGSSRKLVAGIFAAVLMLGAPAAAQTYSDGYLFLKAVQDQDVNKADELLDKPGSTLINSRYITTGRTGLHIAAAWPGDGLARAHGTRSIAQSGTTSC